jgi:heat-inducible transcriptional repressor
VAAMINALCPGETWGGIRQRAARVSDDLAQDVMELVSDILQEAEHGSSYAIHWYGFSDLLSKFEEVDGAQQALRFLDEETLLNEVLSDAIASEDESIKVIVGGDGRYDGISELSMVVGRYGTRHIAGAISVLGPTRMRYGRAISMVRYVSTLMSAMMQDVYGEGTEK